MKEFYEDLPQSVHKNLQIIKTTAVTENRHINSSLADVPSIDDKPSEPYANISYPRDR